MGVIVRSRYNESLENERASLYHLNREVKKGKIGSINSLAKKVSGKKVIESDPAKVADMSVNFFSQLFQGHHRANGTLSDHPFCPDFENIDIFLSNVGKLSVVEASTMVREISHEEVMDAIKDAAMNKSPGLDGLTNELYKAKSDKLAPILKDVFNFQLQSDKLVLPIRLEQPG